MLRSTVLAFSLVFIIASAAFPELKTFSVTVKRVGGEYDSRDDIRELATLEAKRQALEPVGTYIETETIIRDYELDWDEILAIAAGVLSTKQASEEWFLEGGYFKLWLTYEITVETDDVDRRIQVLLNDRQKLDDYKHLQAENSRIQEKMTQLKKQIEEAKPAQMGELELKRQRLSDELSAGEWFDEGLKTDKLHEKINYYTIAVGFDPKLIRAYNNRGTAYIEIGDFDRAIWNFNRAIEINPNDIYACYNRGLLYKKMGDKFKARKDFLKAKELGHPDAQEQLDELW